MMYQFCIPLGQLCNQIKNSLPYINSVQFRQLSFLASILSFTTFVAIKDKDSIVKMVDFPTIMNKVMEMPGETMGSVWMSGLGLLWTFSKRWFIFFIL